MPRSPEDIARLKDTEGFQKRESSCRSGPVDPGDLAQPREAAITTTAAATADSSCGHTNSNRHVSLTPVSSSIPANRCRSASATGAVTCGPGAPSFSPGLRAASWTSHSSWHTAFSGSDQLFSSASSQAGSTPATQAPSVQSRQSHGVAWDLGCDQLVPVIRAGDSSWHTDSSPFSTCVLPEACPDGSLMAAAPSRCDSYHLFGASLPHNTNTPAQAHASTSGMSSTAHSLCVLHVLTTATSIVACGTPVAEFKSNCLCLHNPRCTI
jgi:hypothetical protein